MFEWLVKWYYDLDNVCLVEWVDICDCYNKLREKIIVICEMNDFPFGIMKWIVDIRYWRCDDNCW